MKAKSKSPERRRRHSVSYIPVPKKEIAIVISTCISVMGLIVVYFIS